MLVTSCHHQDGFNEYICWLRLIAKVDFSRLFLPFRNHISGPKFWSLKRIFCHFTNFESFRVWK